MALLRPALDAPTAIATRPALRPMPRHPEPLEIRALLADLLDKPVTVTIRSERSGDLGDGPYLTAVYVSADGSTEVLSSADVAFAAASGAALALIPPMKAEEWVSSRELAADATDNAAEVLNILAATLNDANPTRHVKMIDRWVAGGEAPALDPDAVLGGPRRAIVYTVEIEGYPTGELAISSS